MSTIFNSPTNSQYISYVSPSTQPNQPIWISAPSSASKPQPATPPVNLYPYYTNYKSKQQAADTFETLFDNQKSKVEDFLKRTTYRNTSPLIEKALNEIKELLSNLNDPTVKNTNLFLETGLGSRDCLNTNFDRSLTANIYTSHNLANDLLWIRRSGPISISNHRIVEGDTKVYAAVAGDSQTNPCTGVVVENNSTCYVLSQFGLQPRNCLPEFITKVLPPTPLFSKELKADADTFIANCNNAINVKMPDIKDQRLQSALNTFALGLSPSIISPVVLIDDKKWDTYLRKTSDALLSYYKTEMVKALRIHKMRNDFELVEITLEEYFNNSDKYIVVLDVPKIIKYTSDKYYKAIGIATNIQANLPTLFLPSKMFTSSSKKVLASAYMIIDYLNRGSITDLIDRSRYEAVVKALGTTTKYWDGMFRVLSGNDPEVLKAVIKQYDTHRVTAKLNPDCIENNKLIKTVFSTKEYSDTSKLNKEVIEATANHNKLCSSLNSVTRSCLTNEGLVTKYTYELEQVKHDLITSNAEREVLKSSVEKETDKKRVIIESHVEAIKKLNALELTPDKINPLSQELNLEWIKIMIHNASIDRFNFEIHFNDKTKPLAQFYYTGGTIDLDRHPLNKLLPQAWQGTSTWKALEYILNCKDSSDPKFHICIAQLLSTSNFTIGSMSYRTTKPVKIYVDNAEKPREDCKVVIGGPYYIKVNFLEDFSTKKITKVDGMIFLGSEDAVFGIKSMGSNVVMLKQHPHSKEFKMDTTQAGRFVDFLNSPTVMCFGETQKSLIEAAENKDLEQIRQRLFLWITTAWSKDEWGAQWHYFPTEDQVDLTGDFNKLAAETPETKAITPEPEVIPEPELINEEPDETADWGYEDDYDYTHEDEF